MMVSENMVRVCLKTCEEQNRCIVHTDDYLLQRPGDSSEVCVVCSSFVHCHSDDSSGIVIGLYIELHSVFVAFAYQPKYKNDCVNKK